MILISIINMNGNIYIRSYIVLSLLIYGISLYGYLRVI